MRLSRQASKSAYLIYSIHMGEPPLLIYLGMARPDDVSASLPDAERNSYFREHVASDAILHVGVMASYETAEEAREALGRMINAYQPTCNINGKQASSGKRVRCLDDMREYDNANQAAKAYDCDTSAIYNHLNGKPYFNTVKGRRFERF